MLQNKHEEIKGLVLKKVNEEGNINELFGYHILVQNDMMHALKSQHGLLSATHCISVM